MTIKDTGGIGPCDVLWGLFLCIDFGLLAQKQSSRLSARQLLQETVVE